MILYLTLVSFCSVGGMQSVNLHHKWHSVKGSYQYWMNQIGTDIGDVDEGKKCILKDVQINKTTLEAGVPE